MKLVVMDDSRKRNNQLSELLRRKKHLVVSCGGSGEFMEALEKSSVDRILLNVDTWQRGNAIYKYFGVAKRLSGVPVVFYNAPENFINISARERNEADRVLTKPVEPEAVAEAVE